MIHILGKRGTYTDTYGKKPGWLKFDRVGGRKYSGTWGESGRSGTMQFEVNAEGSQARVNWKTDPSSAVGPILSGQDTWNRLQGSEGRDRAQ